MCRWAWTSWRRSGKAPEHMHSFLRVWEDHVATGNNPEWEEYRQVCGLLCWPQREAAAEVSAGGQGGVEEVNTVRQELKENILTSGRRVGKMFIFQYVPTEQKKKRTLPGNTVGTEVFKCFVSWRQLQKLTLNWNPVLWVWMKIWLRQRTLKKYLTTLDFALLLFSSFHKVQAFTVSKGDT